MAGVLFGIVLFRLGLPSLMPVLIWLPALEGVEISGIAIGLIASSVWQLSRPLLAGETFFPLPVGVALCCAGVGLLVVDYFFVFLSFFEPLLPFFLVVMMGLLVYFSSPDWKGRLFGGLIAAGCFFCGMVFLARVGHSFGAAWAVDGIVWFFFHRERVSFRTALYACLEGKRSRCSLGSAARPGSRADGFALALGRFFSAHRDCESHL
jgi:hypothetical protein